MHVGGGEIAAGFGGDVQSGADEFLLQTGFAEAAQCAVALQRGEAGTDVDLRCGGGFVGGAYAVMWIAVLGYSLRLRSLDRGARAALEHAKTMGGAA